MDKETTDLTTISTSAAPLTATGASALADFERAQGIAQVIVSKLEPMGVFIDINEQRYLTFRGWQMIGSWLNVTAQTEFTERLTDDDDNFIGYRAKAIAVTRDGQLVGQSYARCLSEERNWKNRPEFALESMAETRAKSKALRDLCGPIVYMANNVSGRISDLVISDSPADINDHRMNENEAAPTIERPAPPKPPPPGPKVANVTSQGITKVVKANDGFPEIPVPETFPCQSQNRPDYCTHESQFGIALQQRSAANVKGGPLRGQDAVNCTANWRDGNQKVYCDFQMERDEWISVFLGNSSE